MTVQQSILHQPLTEFCETLEREFDLIPTERKEQLLILRNYLSFKFSENETPKLVVICTHNSRRSHIGQLWLAIGAAYYNLPEIQTFSGGTEATGFNIRAVLAMQRIGLEITTKDLNTENATYLIKWKEIMFPYQAFSKKYDDEPNPTEKFGAIMVCTSADETCPFVTGCDLRLSLPFEDPKMYDNTPLESEKYDERARQIGREILFALSQIQH